MVDALLLLLTIAPLALAIVLKVLFTPDAPLEDGVSISGALVYFTIPMPLQAWPITEAQINSWAVILSILGLCLYLTHGIKVVPDSKRQLAAEWIVDTVSHLVTSNMGEKFIDFAPFVAGILGLSALSSLSSLLGLFAPTSDLNIVLGWAILVFILITHYKLKGGLWEYIKGFFSPIPLFAPLNIIGEFATPISMSFRHYGNVMSGMVISTLIAYALRSLSKMLLGWLPGALGTIPFLQIGLPAVLSLYFDIFSGCMQAFIFAMLTMMFVSTAEPEEE
ncbi:MAG: F0F1 ATP synthase subunit A [Clostridia bacterium]|nr:F0F1 ATP synthase subunit A [Clostridia bacterium]MBR0406866.1 F0F1 ATP synthase subunit A [Clostridia bacterium]